MMMMKVLSGDKRMMDKWMNDIVKCVVSGGKDCAPIKGVPKEGIVKDVTKARKN